jgi:vacuolar-type H+-ATPase subunit D/Vma8
MSYWQTEAAKIENKTLDRHGRLIDEHLKNSLPDLRKSLEAKNDLTPFLLVQQDVVTRQIQEAVNQGADHRQAEAQALNEMMESFQAAKAAVITRGWIENMMAAPP